MNNPSDRKSKGQAERGSGVGTEKVDWADDMRLAAEWLDVYEEGTAEGDACRRVADYLRKEADRAEEDATAYKIAKQIGKPKRLVKLALRRIKAQEESLSSSSQSDSAEPTPGIQGGTK